MRKSMLELDDSLLEALPKDSVIIASLLHVPMSKSKVFMRTKMQSQTTSKDSVINYG